MKRQQSKRRPPARHPMQPVVMAKDGVIRFKQNGIVNYLVDWCAGYNGHVGYAKIDGPAPDINQIVRMVAEGRFSRDDLAQLDQLVGYSVSGCPNLPPRIRAAADAEAERIWKAKHKRRSRRSE